MLDPSNTSNGDDSEKLSLLAKAVKIVQEGINDGYKTINDTINDLVDELDDSNASLTAVFGQTQKSVAALRQEIAVSIPGIIGMGGQAKDAYTIQESIAKQLQTNVITSAEVAEQLYAGGKVLGFSVEQSGRVVTNFQNAGIQTGQMVKDLQSTADIARRVGVNTSAVFELVEQNLNQINRYGFQDGVNGLARMSAQAAGLRIRMSETFDFADKVFNPEGAIDMVATFQRLGVAAGDLADPFRLMYLASEDVEELQNQVVNMTEKFVQFDEKNGRFKVLPNAKRDLIELQKATGYQYDELVKMGEGAAKLQLLQKDFKVGGFDKESQQFIANVAQYSKEKGGFTVKLGVGDEKLISELNVDDFSKIEEYNKPKKLEDLARDQLSTTQSIESMVRQFVFGAAAPVAGSRFPSDVKDMERAISLAGKAEIDKLMGNPRNTIKTIDSGYKNLSGAAIGAFEGKFSFSDAKKMFDESTKTIYGNLEKFGQTLESMSLSDIKPFISDSNLLAKSLGAGADAVINFTDKLNNAFATGKPLRNTNLGTNTTPDKPQNYTLNGGVKVDVDVNGLDKNISPDLYQKMMDAISKAVKEAIEKALPQGQYGNVPSSVPR
jgi:hypothetical protein